MKEAMYYLKINDESKEVQCQLCPHMCIIKNNYYGKCGVRKNNNGVLYSVYYGKPCSITTTDPIEKKPLYHFLPGNKCLSIATLGCNLFCGHCQNWEISQLKNNGEEIPLKKYTPEEVISICKKNKLKIIAYTYTEPTIFYEYMYEIMKLAKKEGIRNVIVSNGHINPKPLKRLIDEGLIDAANIDLKSIKEEFYNRICGAKIKPVLNTIKTLYDKGVHLEITNLIITGENDSEEEINELVMWIKKNLSTEVPIHFSAFHPEYKMMNKEKASESVVIKARKKAIRLGINYVYTGNILYDEGSTTYCPECNKGLILRKGFSNEQINTGQVESSCKKCGRKIYGFWS